MGRIIIAIVVVLVAGTVTYSISVILSVKASAERFANQNPYCVQVATHFAYREVTSSLDLAGFRMKGNVVRNHAVLVVDNPEGPKLYHWSYWQNSFIEGAYGNPPILCNPRHDFLGSLGDFEQDGKRRLTSSYLGFRYKFSIPSAYRPEFSGLEQLSFYARAPEFKPVHKADRKRLPSPFFTVYFGHDADTYVESWRLRPNKERKIESLGLKYGLVVERVFNGRTSPDIQYYTVGDDGSTTTLIRCFDDVVTQCSHAFYDGQFSYGFHQMPSDLTNWKGIQENARAIFDGFLVESEMPNKKVNKDATR